MLMFDAARSNDILFQCDPNANYATIAQNGGIPNGCGQPTFAIIYFLSFQIIVSQIFLNLFIAIIIDSFIIQSEAMNMPITPNDIETFVHCWKKYDQNAKGYIMAHQLEELFIDLAEEQCEMIAFKTKLIKDSAYRRRFIASLEIPTFRTFSQFMFYDVLQMLCQRTCEHHYNAERIQERKEKLKVVKALQGQQMTEADLALHAAVLTKEEFQNDFADIITNMRKLDPKIELFSTLKQKSSQIGRKYSRGIDRIQYDSDHKGNQTADIYTSAHYIYGNYILAAWKEFIKMKKGGSIDASNRSFDGGDDDGKGPGKAPRLKIRLGNYATIAPQASQNLSKATSNSTPVKKEESQKESIKQSDAWPSIEPRTG